MADWADDGSVETVKGSQEKQTPKTKMEMEPSVYIKKEPYSPCEGILRITYFDGALKEQNAKCLNYSDGKLCATCVSLNINPHYKNYTAFRVFNQPGKICIRARKRNSSSVYQSDGTGNFFELFSEKIVRFNVAVIV